MLRAARELDDAVLHLRLNERETAVIQLKTLGDPALAAAHDRFIDQNQDHWLAREIRHLWKRVLKRVDLTSRTLVAVDRAGLVLRRHARRARLRGRPLLHARSAGSRATTARPRR